MERRSYHWTLRLIHWLVVLCVVMLVPIGMTIEGYDPEVVKRVDATLGKGGFDTIYTLHKSLGLTVLALMLLRLAARAKWGAPDYDPPLTPFEATASWIAHRALYVLLIAAPIVGWIGVSLYPAPAPWFWLVDLRLPLEKDRELSEALLQGVHGSLAWLMVLVVLIHVAGALRHLIVKRDGVFRRMTG